MKNNKIPICFTFDRNYVLPAEVAIYSLLYTASKQYVYKLYILHTDLVTKDKKYLQQIVNNFANASLEFIDVSKLALPWTQFDNKSHFSKEIYFKLILAGIFPQYDRIIISDVDVIFNDDISPLYHRTPEKEFYYSGMGPIDTESLQQRMCLYKGFTREEQDSLYHEIAAGLMLVNLFAIRRDNKENALINCYKQNYKRFILPEQDCIALVCWPNLDYFPTRYLVSNLFYKKNFKNCHFFEDNPQFSGDKSTAISYLQDALDNPVQLHYVGTHKPWNSFCCAKYRLWLRWLHKTPFRTQVQYLLVFPKMYWKRISQQYNFKRFISKRINQF